MRRADAGLLALIAGVIVLRLGAEAVLAGGPQTMGTNLCQWDCAWYVHTARDGYDVAVSTLPKTRGEADWAFFPVFPALMRAAAWLFHISPEWGGLLVSVLCFAGFMFLGARYLARLSPGISAPALVWFIAAFPFGFYFTIAYSESVYALLAILAFYLIGARRFLAAALAIAVLTATRVTGLLLLPVLAAGLLAPAWKSRDRAALRAAILPLAIAPLGLLGFMLFLHARAGDALAFVHIQTAWGRVHEFPLYVLARCLVTRHPVWMFSPSQPSPQFCALCALAGLALAWHLLLRRRYGQAWFLAATILLALTSGIASMPRYVLANPVFLLFVFEAFWLSRFRAWFAPGLAAGAVLQLYLVHLWVQGNASLI